MKDDFEKSVDLNETEGWSLIFVARDGKCIEELGTYQPRQKGQNYTLDLPRAQYWLSKGAQPSETVASFIKKAAKAAPVAA